MNNITWYKGKQLKRAVQDRGDDLPHLAVAMILMAREQGLDMNDIVHQLILANQFDDATVKVGREQALRDLGF